jgi:hypothetical protein
MKAPFLNKRNWSSRLLFNEIANSGWVNPGINQKFEEFFLADLCSEYDSINLYHHLYPRRSGFSSYFVQYLDLWFLDEKNHADGFIELNRLLFNLSEEDLLARLKIRVGNFDELEEIFSTELSLLIAFAYDEYISVKTYKKDIFYNDFDHPLFNTWIEHLIADEATHFGNAIKLLKHDHSLKLEDAEKILHRIVQLESAPYRNTFLLDHDGPHFLLKTTSFENTAINEILSILAKGRT